MTTQTTIDWSKPAHRTRTLPVKTPKQERPPVKLAPGAHGGDLPRGDELARLLEGVKKCRDLGGLFTLADIYESLQDIRDPDSDEDSEELRDIHDAMAAIELHEI